MKKMSFRSVYVSLTSLALVFSLAGCAKTTTTSTEVETTPANQSAMQQTDTTGEAKASEMVEAGKGGIRDLTEKAKQGADSLTAQTNQTIAALEDKAEYDQAEKQEFLSSCKASCVKESPKTATTVQYCDLYCGCTHDNLQSKVPLKEVQAYSEGKPTDSSTTIKQIQGQCVRDSHTATEKPATHKS